MKNTEKAGKADIGHGVLAVTERPFALVRKTGADGFQFGEQGFQRGHGDSESKNAPRRQAKSSRAVRQSEEFHALLHFGLASGRQSQDLVQRGYSGKVPRAHLELLYRKAC